MAARVAGQRRIHPAWWTVMLIGVIGAIIVMTTAFFTGALKSPVKVTLFSDRAGLVMETGSKVKMRGVQVGRVAQITGGNDPVKLTLDIDPDQIPYIPTNFQAQILAT